MALPTITGEFRAAADPELRFSASGVAVAKIRLVSSSRRLNKDTNEWEDDKTCWIDCTVFKDTALHLAESVTKSDLVTVVGKLQTDEWEDEQGNKRSKLTMIADSIGPSLRFRDMPHGQGQAQRTQGAEGQAPDMANDPWATPSATEEPPF